MLQSAARGHIGVDRRLLRSILGQGESGATDVLRFARSPKDGHRIDLEPLLIDLLRHYGSRESLDFYIDAIRRSPEDVDDSLVQALLTCGGDAVGPLLSLYEELGEEQGFDVAFLLAGLRVRDPRVLALLLDRLEYDAGDGALCLGLYGDPAARPALETMLAEIPPDETELRRELAHALDLLDAPEPEPHYQSEPFDVGAEYLEHELPPFDLLPDEERLGMLTSEDSEVRGGAAHSFFNQELNPKSRAALLELAKSDPDAEVRGRAWESLADVTDDDSIRDAMIAVLTDGTKDVAERGGAAVGLYGVADKETVRRGIEALYELGGAARVKALEAMWRSLWEPYAKFFPNHLDDSDPAILRQALRGAGYFQLTRYAGKIAEFFDRDEPYEDLREDALFAYAMAMPGETTRGRVRGMLRKIHSLAHLTPAESELVRFALDERLRLHGLEPVFQQEDADEIGYESPSDSPQSAPQQIASPQTAASATQKVGRNDPCPCGSGKKYKRCCGA